MFFENNFIFIEKEDSKNPWVKIFTKVEYKEISDCDENCLKTLLKATLICEKAMIKFYSPDKINIASFANYIPRVHIHVIARFKNDDYFPESMWGKKQRDSNMNLPKFELFKDFLIKQLKSQLN